MRFLELKGQEKKLFMFMGGPLQRENVSKNTYFLISIASFTLAQGGGC